MAKQSIFSRITQLARADISALLENAEDPRIMLHQMVGDYKDNISDAEKAIAQTIGNLHVLQDDYRVSLVAAQSWSHRAVMASNKADESQAMGKNDVAQKFDDLAKVAIQRQMKAESEAQAIEPNIRTQERLVEELILGLDQMKEKLHELITEEEQLIAHATITQAHNKITVSMQSCGIADPTGEVARFEEKIRQEEARVRGAQEIAVYSLENQLTALECTEEKTEIEARLAALKVEKKKDQPTAFKTTPDLGNTNNIQNNGFYDDNDFYAEKELRIDYGNPHSPQE